MNPKKGITFNGKHSFEDLGLIMPNDPQIRFPSKVKNKIRIPGTNIVYDRALIKNIQELTDRTIVCTFNVADFDQMTIEKTHQVASELMDWVMTPDERVVLELDIMPGWHFKAEVESVGDFDTGFFEIGLLEVTFLTYPYKIREEPEGNDVWDIFDFENDVVQDVKFTLPSIESQMPFRELEVGAIVHLGAWAQYLGSVRSDGRSYSRQRAYEITNKRVVAGDPRPGMQIFGNREYTIENVWIREQDIVEARTLGLEVTLHNISSHRIFPEIVITGQGGTIPGVTIVKEGQHYPFSRYAPVGPDGVQNWELQPIQNDDFYLDPGENIFTIYGQSESVQFIWNAEVW